MTAASPAPLLSPEHAKHRSEPLTTAGLIRTTVTAVLLALLVTWMFSAWWSTPRASDVAQLDRSLAAGEVTGLVQASGIEPLGAPWGSGGGPAWDEHGKVVVWSTTSGQSFYLDLRPGSEIEAPSPTAAAIEERARAAGVPHTWDQGSAPALAFCLMLGCLLVLVGAPDPRRGTRWFWLWVGAVPGGLGVLAWLLLERVWPPSTERPSSSRHSGLLGFGVMLASGFVAALVIYGLRDVFGPWLIPG